MDTQNTILVAAGASAAAAVVGLTIAQSDAFSRKFLTPQKLQNKRLHEYAYRWEQATEKALLRSQIYLAGGLNAHEAVQMQTPASSPQQQMQMSPTKIWDEEGLKDLVQEWMKQEKQLDKESKKNGGDTSSALSPFPRILGLSREEDSRDILIELYHGQSGMYQLPLLQFGLILADILEDTLTTTALCFVADASSGLGSQMVADMLDASKAGVAIIREPSWMCALAKLASERVVSNDKLKRLVFGLSRMEALRVRDQVGEARTVLFTIPGQSTCPILLPLIQSAFPEDRHVFAFDGCVASVERALYHRNQYKRATVPTSLEDSLSLGGDPSSSDPIRYSTPLRSSLSRSVLSLSSALNGVRLYYADTVESWMGSVDAFFKLKEDENTNSYLPYTLKLQLLVGDPNGSLEPDSQRHYSLSSLLQFITGCRSRPLPEGVLDAAREWLRDYAHENKREVESYAHMTELERKAVENCVFQHKLILIGDKTLKDTVLPKKHWTLKQAAKAGCSCCAPEEEEEIEEELQRGNQTSSTGVSSRDDSRPEESGTNSAFVDGKSSFAFDPSKFPAPAPAPAPAPKSTYVDGKAKFAFDPSKFS